MSNPKNQAERAPILLSRAWSGLDTSFHEISFASHQLLHRRETVGAQAEGNLIIEILMLAPKEMSSPSASEGKD